jgi:Flp pilus assembly pilin Flp
MVGFIAVAAGAVVPGVVTNIRSIFDNIATRLADSANAGS